MTHRWQQELDKLRTLTPGEDLWGAVAAGPRAGADPSSTPRLPHRIVAGLVAVAVFAAAGAFAWDALRPSGVVPLTGHGATVPPFIVKVLDRGTAPKIVRTTESRSKGDRPHVLDITYGQDVGRWSPGIFRRGPNGGADPLNGPRNDPYLYPDTDPALNAGAPVQLTTQAKSTTVWLIPITSRDRRTGSTVVLRDGGVLPGPGLYML